jgi:hypothetical protein
LKKILQALRASKGDIKGYLSEKKDVWKRKRAKKYGKNLA